MHVDSVTCDCAELSEGVRCGHAGAVRCRAHGSWWGHSQFDEGGMRPDMMVFAKGIASGYPLAGLAARPQLFDKLAPGTLGGTYGGNAVAAAAAVATIDTMKQEGVLDNVKKRGIQLMRGKGQGAGGRGQGAGGAWFDLAARCPAIIDVRGRGLMVGLELGAPDGSRQDSSIWPGCGGAVTKACAQRSMLLMTAGARESIRFLPALTVSESEVQLALATFEEALLQVLQSHTHK
ncbi:hypothetical protein QJQ45_029840 [Haematococcus lacustris]|nr:hypothetical protein QJQ45_029840 [Haematococcus lacustris]